jgi:hypothetical protein
MEDATRPSRELFAESKILETQRKRDRSKPRKVHTILKVFCVWICNSRNLEGTPDGLCRRLLFRLPQC